MEEVWGEAGLGFLSELTFLSWGRRLYLKIYKAKLYSLMDFYPWLHLYHHHQQGFER